MIERKNKRTAKIGIFAVAHATYWEQFEGLLDNIMKYHNDFCQMTKENDVEVFDFGMVDSGEKAFECAKAINAADVDVIFCNMVTYATSSVFAPIVRETTKPIVLIALQPRKAMDYTKACNTTLRNLLGASHNPRGEVGLQSPAQFVGHYDEPDWYNYADVDSNNWTNSYNLMRLGAKDVKLELS